MCTSSSSSLSGVQDFLFGSAKMTPLEGANLIRKSLVQSNLHFFVNESPPSMWITIRKRFIIDHFNPRDEGSAEKASENDTEPTVVKQGITEDDYEKLQVKYDQLKKAFDTLKYDFECEISELEAVIKEENKLSIAVSSKDLVIGELRQEIGTLKSEIETTDSNFKKNNKLLKGKEKEIHDLKKEQEKVKDEFVRMNRDFKELTAKVKKEEKEHKRKEKSLQKKDFLNNLKSETKKNAVTCDVCENTFEDMGKLKLHMRNIHVKHISTQTEVKIIESKTVQTSSIEFAVSKETQCSDEKMFLMNDKDVGTRPKFRFEKHLCASCEKTFASESHLKDHKQSCHGTQTMPGPYSDFSDLMTFPIGFPSSTAFPFWLPPR